MSKNIIVISLGKEVKPLDVREELRKTVKHSVEIIDRFIKDTDFAEENAYEKELAEREEPVILLVKQHPDFDLFGLCFWESYRFRACYSIREGYVAVERNGLGKDLYSDPIARPLIDRFGDKMPSEEEWLERREKESESLMRILDVF